MNNTDRTQQVLLTFKIRRARLYTRQLSERLCILLSLPSSFYAPPVDMSKSFVGRVSPIYVFTL